MTEFSIFFHQNQLLKIRKFQDKVCNFLIQNGILCAPVAPIRIQCENLNEKSKITKITLETKNLRQLLENVIARSTATKQSQECLPTSMRLLRYARNDEPETARNDESETARNDEKVSTRNGAGNGILSLEAKLEIDGNETQRKIELVRILGNANSPMRLLRCARNDELRAARNDELRTARNDEIKIDFSELSEIKRISPFKICELEITKTEKSAQWKILSEKWMKSK